MNCVNLQFVFTAVLFLYPPFFTFIYLPYSHHTPSVVVVVAGELPQINLTWRWEIHKKLAKEANI